MKQMQYIEVQRDTKANDTNHYFIRMKLYIRRSSEYT